MMNLLPSKYGYSTKFWQCVLTIFFKFSSATLISEAISFVLITTACWYATLYQSSYYAFFEKWSRLTVIVSVPTPELNPVLSPLSPSGFPHCVGSYSAIKDLYVNCDYRCPVKLFFIDLVYFAHSWSLPQKNKRTVPNKSVLVGKIAKINKCTPYVYLEP